MMMNIMKKFAAMVAVCLMSMASHASEVKDVDDLEDMLIEQDLIDDDFKYTDVAKVDMLFKEVSDDIRQEQFADQDNGLKIINFNISAYQMDMSFYTEDTFNKEQLDSMQAYFSSEDVAIDGCYELYTSEFFRANDYVIEMTFVDGNYNLMGTVLLNNEVCG